MEPSTQASDDELLRGIACGDEASFTTFYRRKQSGIYRFALHMSNSQSLAEDVTQEVFIVLMREANRYDAARGSVNAYLFGIARNYVLRLSQRGALFTNEFDKSMEDEIALQGKMLTPPANPFDELARTETIGVVRQAIGSLPPRYREVIVLCDLHEMSYSEASEVVDCQVGTIRSRLHRARQLLMDKLRHTRDKEKPQEKEQGCFA